MFRFSASYTDLYELTMAQVYFHEGLAKKRAVFDYFFRTLPYNGGYAIFCGLSDFLKLLKEFYFSKEDLYYLKEMGFSKDFLEYLKSFRFSGNIYSVREGEVVFPCEIILQVEGNLIEVQIIETLLLNILNFETLIATKASRVRLVALDKILADFGLRRAHGPGGYFASKAILMGGFDATSNVILGRDFKIPVTGTMAHSFVQCFSDELTAFRTYANANPENCILLVDTYDTLKSGVPNAIRVAKELEQQGYKLKAIRIDSGDLAYLSRESRKMLDKENLSYVKIAVSNQLDEYIVKSLIEQNSPIDIFGVGTNLIVGRPNAALDGVYKLALLSDQPKIKVSNSLIKTTIPGKKQIYRLLESNQWVGADVVALEDEKVEEILYMFHPFEPDKQLKIKNYQKIPILKPVMIKGKIQIDHSIHEVKEYVMSQLKQLPQEYKRFINPHIYKIGISEKLLNLREKLIKKYRTIEL